MTKLNFLLSIVLSVSAANAATTSYPFGRSIDIDLLEKIASAPTLQAQANVLQAQGVAVYKISGTTASNKDLFDFLPEAPEALKKQLGDEVQDRSMVISPYDSCCQLKNETVLLASDAPAYLLVREAAHALLQLSLSDESARANAKAISDGWAIERRFEFNIRHILDDPSELVGEFAALWRQNLMEYTADYAQSTVALTRALFSEETLSDIASVQVLKKLGSPALNSDAVSAAKQDMDFNLNRIGARVSNVENVIANLLKSDIYGPDSGYDIPEAERKASLARLDQILGDFRGSYDDMNRLAAMVKETEAANP